MDKEMRLEYQGEDGDNGSVCEVDLRLTGESCNEVRGELEGAVVGEEREDEEDEDKTSSVRESNEDFTVELSVFWSFLLPFSIATTA